MTVEGKQAFGLVEFDRARGVFVGKIIGFEHIEFEEPKSKRWVVERMLRGATTAMIASDSLVLESIVDLAE